MEKINQSVVKKDHASKISGQAVYVGDYPNENVLVGKLLRSKFAPPEFAIRLRLSYHFADI